MQKLFQNQTHLHTAFVIENDARHETRHHKNVPKPSRTNIFIVFCWASIDFHAWMLGYIKRVIILRCRRPCDWLTKTALCTFTSLEDVVRVKSRVKNRDCAFAASPTAWMCGPLPSPVEAPVHICYTKFVYSSVVVGYGWMDSEYIKHGTWNTEGKRWDMENDLFQSWCMYCGITTSLLLLGLYMLTR